METKYCIRFTGILQAGLSHEDVVTNLLNLTNLDREKAEALLSSGKPRVLKKDADLETAEKYRTTFEKAGMVMQVERMDATVPPQPAAAKTETVQPTPLQMEPPAQQPPANEPPPLRRNVPENPYAAPKADLKVKTETRGQWLNEPQKVPASQGWQWLKSAVSMFFERPWTWMGMWLALILMTFILNIVPFVGIFCSGMLGAVLHGGLVLAAQAQSNGEQVKVSHVFLGFSHNRNQLILVGLYYILVIFFSMILFGIIGFGAASGLRLSDPGAMSAAFYGNMSLFLIIFLLILLLAVQLMMAYWFAPALTALADQSALNAYKLSFRACLKNWAAFLVFSLALLIAGIVFLIIFASVSGVLAFFISQKGSFVAALGPIITMAILGIPLASILGLTIFTGFKDIFYTSA